MKNTLLIALLSLSGCMSIDEMAEKQGEATGAPRWKIDAVKHGCNSGRSDAGNIYAKWHKDYDLYKSNPDYAMVWDDAYRGCKSRYEADIKY